MFPEYNLKLQSVETRCKILEKQLNHMRKMVENGNKERQAVMEKRVFQKSANQKKLTFTNLYVKLDHKIGIGN